MAQTGRNVRCKRCKKNVANSLELDGWGIDIQGGEIAGYICPSCIKPNESQPLPEGATLDIGHGYENNGPIAGGNFKFLKKLVDAPDYYGRREARLDWEQFSDILRRAMEAYPNKSFQMALENQILWNFVLIVEVLPSGERILRSTGFHTHGMKKGKHLDAHLMKNLSSMGMAQPEGDERNWTITLTSAESVGHNLNKIIVHILERGYEFNPNLIQSLEFDTYPGDN